MMATQVDSDLKIISADDHMDLNVLPVDLWQERLPRALREAGPRVVKTDGDAFWQAEGVSWGPSGRKEKGYIEKRAFGFRPSTPALRLEDMDEDGVQAQVIFGPPQGFRTKDSALGIACFQAYNDWAIEFNRAAPDRLVALPMLPVADPAIATAELQRVAALGHKAVQVGPFQAKEPVFETGWEAFWATAEETGLPICLHIGGGYSNLRGMQNSWRNAALVCVLPIQLDEILAGLIFSGLLERYPRLRVVFVECGLGWLPYFLDRMDHEHRKYLPTIQDIRLSHLPTELFARQIWVTYEEDPLGLQMVDHIGADRIMWASDYPHGDTTWPESRAAIARSLAHLSPSDRAKIISSNAAEVFGIG